MHVPPPRPDPGFPSHSITASKVSPKLTLTWVKYWVDTPQEGFYRTSSDGGTSWDSSAQLPAPPAFGGDTAPSFYLGVFPYYDRHDRLHVVAEVVPLRGGQQYVMPAEIWPYHCEFASAKVIEEMAGAIGKKFNRLSNNHEVVLVM